MTPSTESNPEADPVPAGGVPKVGDIIDGKVVVDPRKMLRDDRGRWLPGQRPTTGIVPGDTARASAMAKRLHEKRAIAARNALADRAAERGLARSPVAAAGLLAGMAFEGALSGFSGDKVVNADGSEWYRVDRRGGVAAGTLALKLADMMPQERNVQQVALQQVVVTGGRQLDAIEGEWEEG